MRRLGLLVAIAPAIGCFEEIPTPPGGTGGASTTAATMTTAAATMMMTEDVDVTEPTAGSAPPEGLFKCGGATCDAWDCSGGCTKADAAGQCVLAALRDRTPGSVTVIRCDGECREHVALPRAGGTDEVEIQSRTQAAPPVYAAAQRCTLKPPAFFAGCLTKFEASCADPKAWVEGCAAAEPSCQ